MKMKKKSLIFKLFAVLLFLCSCGCGVGATANLNLNLNFNLNQLNYKQAGEIWLKFFERRFNDEEQSDNSQKREFTDRINKLKAIDSLSHDEVGSLFCDCIEKRATFLADFFYEMGVFDVISKSFTRALALIPVVEWYDDRNYLKQNYDFKKQLINQLVDIKNKQSEIIKRSCVMFKEMSEEEGKGFNEFFRREKRLPGKYFMDYEFKYLKEMELACSHLSSENNNGLKKMQCLLDEVKEAFNEEEAKRKVEFEKTGNGNGGKFSYESKNFEKEFEESLNFFSNLEQILMEENKCLNFKLFRIDYFLRYLSEQIKSKVSEMASKK